MKLVLSPAKSLDFERTLPTTEYSLPRFADRAEVLNGVLAKKSRKSLAKLMGISDKLASLNYERYQNFSFPHTPDNARPAVYAFSGDVYIGLDVYSLPGEKIDQMQDCLRILSGMYGLLRPLDLIQPYRLEMGTELTVNRKKGLYKYWGNTLTDALNEELEDDGLFLNLASVEYFKSVNPQRLKTTVISPVFKDFKNGELKIISFFAKKARGSMARYALDNNIQTYDELLGFDYDGYQYSETHTEEADKPVFIR